MPVAQNLYLFFSATHSRRYALTLFVSMFFCGNIWKTFALLQSSSQFLDGKKLVQDGQIFFLQNRTVDFQAFSHLCFRSYNCSQFILHFLHFCKVIFFCLIHNGINVGSLLACVLQLGQPERWNDGENQECCQVGSAHTLHQGGHTCCVCSQSCDSCQQSANAGDFFPVTVGDTGGMIQIQLESRKKETHRCFFFLFFFTGLGF